MSISDVDHQNPISHGNKERQTLTVFYWGLKLVANVVTFGKSNRNDIRYDIGISQRCSEAVLILFAMEQKCF